MKNLRPTSGASFLLEIVAVVLIPALIIASALYFFKNRMQVRALEKHLEQSLKTLQMIKREGDNSSYIQKRLNLIYGMLSEEIIRPETIQKFLQRAKAEGLGFADFRFFDDKGRHIPLQGESEVYRVFIRKIFAALVQPELEGKSNLLVEHSSFFESFLGKIKPAMIANEKSSLVRVNLKGKPGWFYWNSFYSHLENGRFKGGMIVFFPDESVPVNFALKRLLDEVNAASDNSAATFAGLVYLNRTNSDYYRPDLLRHLDAETLRSTVVRMRKDLLSQSVTSSGQLTAVALDAEKSLISFRPRQTPFLQKLTFLLSLLLMISVVAAIRLLFNFFCAGGKVLLDSAKRLKIAVIAASCLPLTAFVFSSFYMIYLHQRVSEQELSDRLTGFINAVDERYVDAVKELERDYLAFAKQLEKNGDSGQCLNLAKSYHANNSFRQAFILSSKSKLNFSYPENAAFGGIINKLLPTLGQRLFAARSGADNSWRNRVNDMMFEAMSENLSELLGDPESRASFMKIFEKTDQIVEFWLANRKFFVFTSFLETGQFRESPELLVIWHDADSFSSQFLKKQVRRYMNLPETQQPIRLAMKARRADQPPFPGELAKYSFSVEMFEKVIATENQQFAVVAKDGENWLVVASPLKRADDFVLFAMQSLRAWELEAMMIKCLLLIMVLASLLIAWRLYRILATVPE